MIIYHIAILGVVYNVPVNQFVNGSLHTAAAWQAVLFDKLIALWTCHSALLRYSLYNRHLIVCQETKKLFVLHGIPVNYMTYRFFCFFLPVYVLLCFIQSVEYKLYVSCHAVQCVIYIAKHLLAETAFLLFKETTGKFIIYFLVQRFQPHGHGALTERSVRRIEYMGHEMAFAARKNKMHIWSKLYV